VKRVFFIGISSFILPRKFYFRIPLRSGGITLGHTQVKTTQRYAHLARETLVEASNAGTMAIAPALGIKTQPAMTIEP